MNDKPKWLIAVGGGRWQLPGIQAARTAGLRVLVLDGDASAQGFAIGDASVVVDIRQPAAVVEAVKQWGALPAGAISFCNEAGMLASAALREHFSLPGPRTDVVRRLIDKGLQRRAWTDAGLPCPRWAVVTEASAVEEFLGSHRETVIFKPVDSAGSRGVRVVQAGESWEDAFHFALQQSLSGRVIVEQFIVGLEHTVESFTHRGQTHVLAVTSKRKVPGTMNTVAFELATAAMPPEERAAVDELCADALRALNYTDGPGHMEMLRTDDGKYHLVEAAGRGGGFMVADGIVPQVSGYDLATACALQAVGLEPPSLDHLLHRGAVLRFVPSVPGVVESISGFDPADEVAGTQAAPMVAIGQQVRQATTDGDRMAYILSYGNDRANALRRADEREARIQIRVR